MTHTQTQGADGAGASAQDPIAILYTNYRGETAVRRIMPCYHPGGYDALWFGETKWHPKPQWLLSAVDCENEHWIARFDSGLARRDFAVADIKAWGQAAVDAALASSTPASAATPGVPDSLRALSEKAYDAGFDASGEGWNAEYPGDATETDAYKVLKRQSLDALIAAQPAGQAGDAGALIGGKGIPARMDAIASGQADPVRAALEASMEARGANRQQAFFREAAARIAPAPNSTRTGAAETIPVPVELVSKARNLAWSVKGDAYLGNEAETELAQEVDRALLAAERDALAARPEAPSDAGWRDISTAPKDGREIDVWDRQEGRITVRWLSVDAACWTNEDGQRRWSEGWFSHWMPLPTPPSDPAPSGQAEG